MRSATKLTWALHPGSARTTLQRPISSRHRPEAPRLRRSACTPTAPRWVTLPVRGGITCVCVRRSHAAACGRRPSPLPRAGGHVRLRVVALLHGCDRPHVLLALPASQIESIFNPVRGPRDAQTRAGIKPVNHARNNVHAVREASQINYLRKQSETEDRPGLKLPPGVCVCGGGAANRATACVLGAGGDGRRLPGPPAGRISTHVSAAAQALAALPLCDCRGDDDAGTAVERRPLACAWVAHERDAHVASKAVAGCPCQRSARHGASVGRALCTAGPVSVYSPMYGCKRHRQEHAACPQGARAPPAATRATARARHTCRSSPRC